MGTVPVSRRSENILIRETAEPSLCLTSFEMSDFPLLYRHLSWLATYEVRLKNGHVKLDTLDSNKNKKKYYHYFASRMGHKNRSNAPTTFPSFLIINVKKCFEKNILMPNFVGNDTIYLK